MFCSRNLARGSRNRILQEYAKGSLISLNLLRKQGRQSHVYASTIFRYSYPPGLEHREVAVRLINEEIRSQRLVQSVD